MDVNPLMHTGHHIVLPHLKDTRFANTSVCSYPPREGDCCCLPCCMLHPQDKLSRMCFQTPSMPESCIRSAQLGDQSHVQMVMDRLQT